ncbi:hypothetical protein [Pseudoalteromonas sp. McH1-42]|uniref:hypothetical protein n=1 Tax=Pseudoalteromonas sp. McH1-42 TaxID=2917752 RepID=UPI001EF5A1F5|nr:hypothetical protein [Pseudoalteromonas sp. McH1-42]MCG7564568.1 hypothetical protein [Pseudoalteromonas sp. McH1-42]
MSISNIKVLKGRATSSELGDALINPGASLKNKVVFQSANGTSSYLPNFENASEAVDGTTAFEPSLSENGELTIYVRPVPPASIKKQVVSATMVDRTTFSLVLNASANETRIPLTKADVNGYQKLTATLTGNNLKNAQESLHDASPNVAIEMTQKQTVAALQTKEFIKMNWSNKEIKDGLFASMGGISMHSPDAFYNIASSADRDYPNQFLVMDITYVSRISAPSLPGFVRWQVSYDGRLYNYYQDNRDLRRVFFVPDYFEFAKGPKGQPSVTMLRFSIPEGANSIEQTDATFRFYGSPIVGMDRIAQAAQSLKDELGFMPIMTSIEDANGSEKAFTLSLPHEEDTSSNYVPQPKATIHLTEDDKKNGGLRDEVHLNFKQFIEVWAAIHSTAPENPLFRGWVDLTLSQGKFKEKINFNARVPAAQQAAFFDSILDQNSHQAYHTQLGIYTIPVLFDKPTKFDDGGEKKVYQIELNFSTSSTETQSVELNNARLQGKVTIKLPIRYIVCGLQTPNEYTYTLRVICDDGTMYKSDRKIKAGETLWITPKFIQGAIKQECTSSDLT